jgi:hypothetical protein
MVKVENLLLLLHSQVRISKEEEVGKRQFSTCRRKSHSASFLLLLVGNTHLLTHTNAASASCGAPSKMLLFVFPSPLVLRRLFTLAMAEAAGLVLGAIPLVFLALDTYQECLEFGKSYAKYDDTLMSIRDEVSVQQMLFEGTMETMGLWEPTYVDLDHCLRDRFPENHKILMRCIRKMDTTISQLMEKLEVDTNSKVGKIEFADQIPLTSQPVK